MLPAMFGSIWLGIFKGEKIFRKFFFNISESEIRIAHGGYVLSNRDKMRNFVEDLTQMFPAKFGFIWPGGFRGGDQNLKR